MEIKLGRRCQKNLHNVLGWESLTEEDKVDKPVIICFSGDGTKHEKEANGFAKMLASNLGIRVGEKDSEIRLGIEPKDFPADILSVTYDGKYNNFLYALQQLDYENGLGEKPVLSDKEEKYYEELKKTIKNFFDKFFCPLLKGADGKRLDVSSAIKNFRNINIVSFCYGTFIVSQIENIMMDEMEKMGYGKDEIDMIQSQIFCIKASPVIKLGTSKFSTVAFSSLDDSDNEIRDYATQELTNPALHTAELIEEVGATVRYSDNEFAFVVPSLSDFNDSHLGREYFSMEKREKQGFSSPSYGDCLPAFLTVLLNDSINNSVLNFNSVDFIPLMSSEKCMEKINLLLQRFQGRSYVEVIKEIYEETRNMNMEYAKDISKEDIEDNIEYVRCVTQYGKILDSLSTLPKNVLTIMDEINALSDHLLGNEYEGKAVVKDQLMRLLNDVKEAMIVRQSVCEKQGMSEDEIEGIESAKEKAEHIRAEIEHMKEKEKAWSNLRSVCDKMVDFCNQVLVFMVDDRDIHSIQKLGGRITSSGEVIGGCFGNGMGYTRDTFAKKFPEIVEKLEPSSLRLSAKKECELGAER